MDMKERNVGSLGSWLIAKRTLIVLNHTRVLASIVAVYHCNHKQPRSLYRERARIPTQATVF